MKISFSLKTTVYLIVHRFARWKWQVLLSNTRFIARSVFVKVSIISLTKSLTVIILDTNKDFFPNFFWEEVKFSKK